MKISLSQVGHSLLKYVLTSTGEKEINPNGQEVDTQRRLNGEESAQRRFFLKVVNPLIEENKKEAIKLIDDFKEEWKKENAKKEEETDKEYESRMNIAISNNKELNEKVSEVLKTKIEVEVTDKTVEVVKKYYKEFGDKNGWLSGDDGAIEEIEAELNR